MCAGRRWVGEELDASACEGFLFDLDDAADGGAVARKVALADEASVTAATSCWEELTGNGGEGMVIKPMSFVARGSRGLIQPALKVRGVEYLRIIYGPEYTLPEHLARAIAPTDAGEEGPPGGGHGGERIAGGHAHPKPMSSAPRATQP